MENLQNAGPDELVSVGVQALRAGNKETARAIFQQALDQDKTNERALFYMASVVPTLEEKQRYLRAVLKVNAKNDKARELLKKLQATTTERDTQTLKTGLIIAMTLVVILIVAIIAVIIIF
jgi:thioredoxin-like negative regulator of GroEL